MCQTPLLQSPLRNDPATKFGWFCEQSLHPSRYIHRLAHPEDSREFGIMCHFHHNLKLWLGNSPFWKNFKWEAIFQREKVNFLALPWMLSSKRDMVLTMPILSQNHHIKFVSYWIYHWNYRLSLRHSQASIRQETFLNVYDDQGWLVTKCALYRENE